MKKPSGITNVAYINSGDDPIVGLEKTSPKYQDDLPRTEPSRDASRSEEVLASRVLTPEEKIEKKQILKNIFIISFAFFFLFTSFNGLINIQSSLNKTSGTTALMALYLAFIISCCLLPSWVLQTLKEKKTMIVCMLLYSIYMVAQFWPYVYTLVPTAAILGLAAAPLWSAKCTYITKVSGRYGDLAGEKKEVIVTRFFGIFFLFFQSTQIVGNLISSLVLSVGLKTSEAPLDEEALSKCGYHFCIAATAPITETNVTGNSTTDLEPPLWQIYTMSGVYLGCALLSAIVIFVFLDPLSKFPNTEVSDTDGQSTIQLMVATFNHMRHPYQLLIIPLTLWSGMEQAFLSTDFTAAYVTCGLGVHMVGYIMICYGACDAVFSLGFTPLVKKLGRVPVFTLAFLINLAIIIALTRWQPHPDDIVWFFVISALWGVADAVWQTQINSLYGVIFPGQSAAAFSNYRLWESIGFFAAYLCSTVLCINDKITILFILLIPGVLCYYIIEVLEKRGSLRRDENGRILPIDKLITGRS